MLQHDEEAGPGLLGDWFKKREFEVELIHVPGASGLPDLDQFDLIVSLGSEHCALDEVPWIAEELEVLRLAHEAGIPILGICFGSQLLALALGGSVERDAVSEVGWHRIDSRDSDLIAEGPWFEWHFDVFTPPAGSVTLASSDAGPEVFRLGHSLGVQFHPEVDRGIIDAWADGSRVDLDRATVERDRLYDELKPDLAGRVDELFESIGKQIGAVS